MYKKILIPLENTATDRAILDHISPLALLLGSHLILVHVADGFGARLQSQLNLADSEEIKKDQAYLDVKCADLNKAGIPTRAFLLSGRPPGEGILDIAQREECDLIAMATHGHGFLQDVILGSVADNLRHNTDIPILMIRASQK